MKGRIIIKTKDKNRKKVKLEHGNGSIYFVESRNRYAGQVTLLINNKKFEKLLMVKLTERSGISSESSRFRLLQAISTQKIRKKPLQFMNLLKS